MSEASPFPRCDLPVKPGHTEYALANNLKFCDMSISLQGKAFPIKLAEYVFETKELSGYIHRTTILEESYILQQATLRLDESGLTSSEGTSIMPDEVLDMNKDDYLIGQDFSLDGCEETYFDKYSPKHNKCRKGSVLQCYEPELEIFQMDL